MPEPAGELSHRLSIALAQLRLKVPAAAEKAGIPHRTLLNVLAGHMPRADVLARLRLLGISADWLLSGAGSPFIVSEKVEYFRDAVSLVAIFRGRARNWGRGYEEADKLLTAVVEAYMDDPETRQAVADRYGEVIHKMVEGDSGAVLAAYLPQLGGRLKAAPIPQSGSAMIPQSTSKARPKRRSKSS